MMLKSVLDDPQYVDCDPVERQGALESFIECVEDLLRRNARGEISAADVCAGLWEIGFDPNDADA